MQAGKVVEQGPAAEVFERPREAYTRALLAAAFDIEAVGPRPDLCVPLHFRHD